MGCVSVMPRLEVSNVIIRALFALEATLNCSFMQEKIVV